MATIDFDKNVKMLLDELDKSQWTRGYRISKYPSVVWRKAIDIRAYRWFNWDVKKRIAIIDANAGEAIYDDWGIPKSIEHFQGQRFINNAAKSTSALQYWLGACDPDYLQAPSHIIAKLDLAKFDLTDVKSIGEDGEIHLIDHTIVAIECPDNKSVMHVMENVPEKHIKGRIITTCYCGRSLQTIKK